MQYIKVAKTSDFGQNHIKAVSILGRPVAIVREGKDQFYAVEATCKHQNGNLAKGRIKGSVATCPRHGWKYDFKTGECLNHVSPPLRRYGLKIEGDDIHISITPIEETD